MAVPLQMPLTIFSLTRTDLQGSASVPAPLYFQPLEPAGLPRPFQPGAGRLALIEGPPPSSVNTRLPPSAVGSFSMGSGSANVVPVGGFEMNLANLPPFTIRILPGMP